MKKRTEIAKGLWQSFCDSYTRQHLGWIVKVDVYEPSLPESGDADPSSSLKEVATDLVFQGLALQDGDSHPELMVTFASDGTLFTFRLRHPTHIVAIETPAGQHEGLLLHDKTGGLVQIKFRVPATPELLDGYIAA